MNSDHRHVYRRDDTEPPAHTRPRVVTYTCECGATADYRETTVRA